MHKFCTTRLVTWIQDNLLGRQTICSARLQVSFQNIRMTYECVTRPLEFLSRTYVYRFILLPLLFWSGYLQV